MSVNCPVGEKPSRSGSHRSITSAPPPAYYEQAWSLPEWSTGCQCRLGYMWLSSQRHHIINNRIKTYYIPLNKYLFQLWKKVFRLSYSETLLKRPVIRRNALWEKVVAPARLKFRWRKKDFAKKWAKLETQD